MFIVCARAGFVGSGFLLSSVSVLFFLLLYSGFVRICLILPSLALKLNTNAF